MMAARHRRHRRHLRMAWILIPAAAAVSSLLVLAVVNIGDKPNPNPPQRTSAALGKVPSNDKSYPQRVDWVTVCEPVKTSFDDPIVFHNQPGRSHAHTFSGNSAVTAFSTPEQLAGGSTNCSVGADHSSYWMPALLVDGRVVLPYVTRAYYRAGTQDGSKISPMPFGLQMLAGDMMATSPQPTNIVGFQCRIEGQGAVIKKQAFPATCPPNAFLEASVVFPNCWDGVHVDSPDHRSHMSYARQYRCDSAHPVQIPQLTLAERFPKGQTAGRVTLAAMNSPLTLHGDFINAWDRTVLQTLVTRCINASVACADVSDRKFPKA